MDAMQKVPAPPAVRGAYKFRRALSLAAAALPMLCDLAPP